MEIIDCGCHFTFQRPAVPRQQWQVEDALQSSRDAPQLAQALTVSILCSDIFMGSSAAELLPEAHRLYH